MKTFLKKKYILFFILAGIFFSACSTHHVIKIALSKGKGSEGYEAYSKWLKGINPEVEPIDLYFINRDKAIEILNQCQGLLLTGGPDVEPARYGKDKDSSRCEIDLKRDSLEFEIIKLAHDRKIPILGICRGMQILNVAFGGSLIVDIPQDFGLSIRHRCEDAGNCFHRVDVYPSSILYIITQSTGGLVNSNHHQAINVLSPEFFISAKAPDGIIEAIEWKEPEDKPYLIGVQWHPERLGLDNKLSYPIGKSFIENAIKFKPELTN